MRETGHDANIFEQFEFAKVRAELKLLNATGNYVEKKKANEMEEMLRENGLLGNYTPEVLSNTLVHMIGFCFALRSGEEHRKLHHKPSQIKLVKLPAYLHYKEDSSKLACLVVSVFQRKLYII